MQYRFLSFRHTRIIFGLFFLLSSSVSLNAQSYRQEADTFLETFPKGLQKLQCEAIQKACRGDGSALQAIRTSRNRPTPLNENVEITEISPTLRLYRPIQRGLHPLPLLIYLHGGGWTFGSIQSCARFCSELTATGEIMVLAVDYRLAPEFPYPDGLNDCLAAWEWARKQAREWGCDPELISMGGDSAGGNLALATVLRLGAGKQPLPHSIVLFYPVVSAWNDRSSSWQNYQKGAGLDGPLMEAFNAAYCQGIDHAIREEAHRNPFISPSVAPDSLLRAMPRTLLVAAERDILCDQGKSFYNRLKTLDVEIERREIPGSVHLFITVPGQERAFRQSIEWTRRFLQTSVSAARPPSF